MIGKYLLILRDLAFIIPFNISIGCKNTFQIPATLGRHSYFEDYLKSLRHLLKHIIDLLCNSKHIAQHLIKQTATQQDFITSPLL